METVNEAPELESRQLEAEVPDACTMGSTQLDPDTCRFYQHTMEVVSNAGIEFLVGGAYALERYTGISRHTKDFDIFVRAEDVERTLRVLQNAGYETEMSFPHWLAKAYCGDLYVDVIFSSGNGLADVDKSWFDNAVDGEVLGRPAKLCPAEEILWSKCFVMERERYDGADVAHLLRACAEGLDWKRLVRRFGDKWRVLFSHLTLFGFIYPAERNKIPVWVMRGLMARFDKELEAPPPKSNICQGTLISRQQFLVDVEQWGYRDARLEPRGNMSPEEVEIWTQNIKDK